MIRDEFQALRKQLEDGGNPHGLQNTLPPHPPLQTFLDLRRSKEAEDPEERRYVMVASVSERRLADIDSERERGTEATASARSELKDTKLHLTPRSLLRQENLSLREQIVNLREQAIEAKEKEKEAAVAAAAAAAAAAASQPRVVMTRSHSDQKDFREVPKGASMPRSTWAQRSQRSPMGAGGTVRTSGGRGYMK